MVFLKVLTFCFYAKGIIRNTELFYKYMIWMCLKTDTILLQYSFYQCEYFIITCLYLVEIYEVIFGQITLTKWLDSIV